MNGSAIVMMVVAMTLVWGGLVLALINIKRSPELEDEIDTPAEDEGDLVEAPHGGVDDAAGRPSTSAQDPRDVRGGPRPAGEGSQAPEQAAGRHL
ncbi:MULTISPECIES: methionine/alanine import family NSS transporter small subunit [Kocuria]|uniref:methionine/alanine import family NSS transporter small subunit n=1 Tax=Kocuria TaxID=57493 RepID=UPI0021A7BFB9|nr:MULTISPECIES: methionine/alanine import family NSS transporter small subunit [Kocuria]MCT1545129.1 methionine/alanine import family NSS transporter small subunit [Kocuria rhizophila]MCT2171671.1 methionine/alanine import family NSS transporter small subunit [Kocuria rhizophila]MDN3463417.1 methionine/alanine import family NSS transporter small subunit [Kocuria sp. APC 4018]